MTEYEEEAQLQRLRWAQLKSLELKLMQMRNDAGGVLFARQREAAAAQAAAKHTEMME